MKQLERRLLKVEESIRMKCGGGYPRCKNMTDEEARKAREHVEKILNGEGPVLFVHTPKGFIDTHQLSCSELEKVYHEYADGFREVYTEEELKAMGHKPQVC